MNDIKTSYKTQEVDRELTGNRQKVDRTLAGNWQKIGREPAKG